MRRLTLCMVLTLSLGPVGTAAAKKPLSAKVCGPSDCRTVKDREALMALSEAGPPTDAPERGSGWYSVRMTIGTARGHHETFPLVIVPSAGRLRGGDARQGYAWMPVAPAAVREYRQMTRGLAPFAAGALRGVGRPRVRVDEVVLPTAEAAPDGGSSPLPWIAAGVVLLAVAGALIRRRGLPWPKPAQG